MTKVLDPTIDQDWHTGDVCGLVTRAALRTLQFTFAVVVAGLYGVDLAHSSKVHAHVQSEWVYAEVVACLSAVTCVVHCFVTVKRVAWSAWDGVLFVFWLAQVGVFGTIYASSVKPGYYGATQSLVRMRIAVWINLVNMLLWFATTVLGVASCIRARKVTRRTDKMDGRKDQGVERDRDEESGYEWVVEKSFVEGDDESIDEKNDENIFREYKTS